jgi:cytochrome P460
MRGSPLPPETPMKLLLPIAALAIAGAAVAVASNVMGRTQPADSPPAGRQLPVYTFTGKLVLPANYRQWVYLGTGLGMSYNPKATASDAPVFDNVFVDPASWQAFQASGTWPELTQMLLEERGASGKGSINQHGQYENGEVPGREMHVKDSARFAGGWGFFSFDDDASAAQIPTTAACYGCHRDHAAVDTTFVQFYPTLLPIARQRQTLSAGYMHDEAARLQASQSR